MPLSSQIASLLFGSQTTQQTRSDFGIVDDGLPGGKQSFADVRFGTADFRSDIMVSVEDEEEARPPYLHVRTYHPREKKFLLT